MHGLGTRLACALILCAGAAACVPSATRTASNEPTVGQLITRETIEASRLSTAWQVLRRYGKHLTFAESATRGPTGVTRRGRESIYLREEPLLVVDGVRVADFRVLGHIPARDLHSMRVLSGAEGSTYYGMGAAGGVVMVRTFRPETDEL